MYVRSRKPAAGIASASTTRYETSNARYISTESAKYGTTEVAMSSRLRPRRGRVYGARASRQKGRPLPGPPELGAAPIAAAGSRVLLAPFPWRAPPPARQPLGASRRTLARCSRRPPSGPQAQQGLATAAAPQVGRRVGGAAASARRRRAAAPSEARCSSRSLPWLAARPP